MWCICMCEYVYTYVGMLKCTRIFNEKTCKGYENSILEIRDCDTRWR